ncbi:dienelactone hydrolase family protein [Fulvivirga lutea]|uniref:Dienelactone hydrolase family protein n=1 Tax=Fulvivirga lutea TaxID=2810512 RepID=A0A974WE37_9BACT|nr:dienelactone hydrolase family protein [Fulvivirga lutea]QSE96568.1 dienelactone hydrolase family protein [Fulvivirga lutea]
MKQLSTKFLVILFLLTIIISCGKKSDNGSDETVAVETTPEYVGEEVTYSTDSTTMKGYLAYDKNSTEKKPGILVVHEWWGHNEYTRKRADMLAELGYVALAVDMYGDGKVAEHPKDAQKFMTSVFSNMDEAEARFDKAMELLKSNENVDPDQIGVVGYCFGGSVALTMANMGKDIDAVAAFHSGLQLPVMPTNDIQAKILVCNGAADPFISEESVETFKSAMDSVNANYKYIAYDSAKHAFTSKGATAMGEKFELPLEYNAKADEASWEEMKTFFSGVFK